MFDNLNKVLLSSTICQDTNNILISAAYNKNDLYTEKITIWEKGILKDILLVIFNNKMNFIYINKEI